MSESYEEAVVTIMRRRKVDEPTAQLMVADIYPTLTAFDRSTEPGIAFDSVDEVSDTIFYTPPAAPGKIVRLDDDRSPAGSLFRQAEVLEAQRSGDRYRAMSRIAGGHYHD